METVLINDEETAFSLSLSLIAILTSEAFFELVTKELLPVMECFHGFV